MHTSTSPSRGEHRSWRGAGASLAAAALGVFAVALLLASRLIPWLVLSPAEDKRLDAKASATQPCC